MELRPAVVPVVLAIALVLASAAFVVDAGSGTGEPVAFESTNDVGLSFEAVREAETTRAVVPRAEVVYGQYPYVVGYNGLPFLVENLGRAARSREFGRPVTVYVSDFSGAGPEVRGDGTLVAGSAGRVDWVAAGDAYFVVDSRAETPAGTPAVVPFDDRDDAASFAERYDGLVQQWDALRNRQYGDLYNTRTEWRRVVARRQGWADRTVADTDPIGERPVSVTVGTDAPTLAAAVERAPPNTTVRVPAGTYEVADLRISKPITIRGAGPDETVVRGDRNGTVVTVAAPGTGLVGLGVDGVGSNASKGRSIATRNDSHYELRTEYGSGAAGIAFDRAPGSLVANVTVETPTHGLLVRESPRLVLSETTVYGPPKADADSVLLGIMASRVVVQDSAFYGGYHSSIALDASGTVFRSNHAEGAITGFHALYSSDVLVADSAFRDMFKPLMTATEGSGNAAVGNDVRNAVLGIDFAGSRSYVGNNTVAHNRIGLQVEGAGTVYAGNVVAYNHVGAQISNPFPTNRITQNDFVGNDRHLRANDENVLFVWTSEGTGNYWGGIDRFDRDGDGIVDSPIRPTSVTGSLSHRAPGGTTISRSPAVGLLRSLQTAVPGLRSSGVVDVAPLATPASPDQVEALGDTYTATGPYRPSHDADPYDYHASYDIPHSSNNTFG